MKLFTRLTILTLAAVLLLALCVSCGKNEHVLDPDMIATYEHSFRNVSEESEEKTEEQNIDSEGFLTCDDYVYVDVEKALLWEAPKEEGDSKDGFYGQQLYRTGKNENGWNRVYLDGKTYYVKDNLVTEMTLDSVTEFTYSLASLDIVDTSRQFYSYEDMTEDLGTIKKSFPDMVSLQVIGLSADGRNIYDMVIGNPEAEHDILLVGGMEACEYMTSLFAAKLCEYYAHFLNEGLYKGYAYSEVFANCRLHIIPMLNPDGASISQYFMDGVNSERIKTNLDTWFKRDQVGGGINLSIENYLMFFRSNANGTELSLNFPYRWSERTSVENPANKDYKGSAEGSEAETKDVLRLIEECRPELVVNLRTSGNNVACNFGMTEDVHGLSQNYAKVLSENFAYLTDGSDYSDSCFGSLEGYASCIKNIPALSVRIGNGDAPLSLNEYNTIWNSGREFPIALMVELMK